MKILTFPVVNSRKSLGQAPAGGCGYWKEGMDKAAKAIANMNSQFAQNPSYANSAGGWGSFQSAQQDWSYYKSEYDYCVKMANSYPLQYNPYSSSPPASGPTPPPPPIPTPTSGPERKPVETGGPVSCGPGQFWDGVRCRGSVSMPGGFGSMAFGSGGTIGPQGSSFSGYEGTTSYMGARFHVMNLI